MGKPRSRTAASGRVTPRRRAPASPTPDELAAADGTKAKPGFVRRFTDVAYQRQAGRDQLVHADSWRKPLIVDLVLGTIIFVVGFWLAVSWHPVGGGGIAALGMLYNALTIRRWKKWAEIRRSDGLDSD